MAHFMQVINASTAAAPEIRAFQDKPEIHTCQIGRISDYRFRRRLRGWMWDLGMQDGNGFGCSTFRRGIESYFGSFDVE